MSLILANWKSQKTIPQAVEWITQFTSENPLVSSGLEVVVLPSFHAVAAVSAAIQTQKSPLVLGVQDISGFPVGAYTGAVAADQLAGLGIKYVVVGHSERRRYFHENHQDVANKVALAVMAGWTPVLCVDKEYLHAQAAALEPATLKKCVVAYEPLEAIGTGNAEPAEKVAAVVAEIRSIFGTGAVLYGGSVTAENCQKYSPIVDGFLVGSHSLDSKNFSALIAQLA